MDTLLQNISDKRFVVILTGLLFVLLVPGFANGDLRLLQLKDRPDNSIVLSKLSAAEMNWTKDILIPLRLPAGASYGILFFVDGVPTAVKYSKKSNNLMFQLFIVANVLLEGDKSVADPLIPVNTGSLPNVKDRQLFYLRITAVYSAVPRKDDQRVIFNDSGGSESIIKTEIEVLPFSLPRELPITIQASIWPYKQLTGNKKAKVDRLKNILQILSDYRINGAAGMIGGIQNIDAENIQDDLEAYKEIVHFCLHDLHFRKVRIPARKMFNPKSPLVNDFPDGPSKGSAFEKDLKTYLSSLCSLIENPQRVGKLGFKLWDEPRPKDYPDVILSYRIARKLSPSLKLELSEQPDAKLENVADVWTPYIKFFNPYDVVNQHRLGKEIWIYANKVHGIDHPLFGMRILGWLLWKYNLDGYLFWAVNWWKEDPWETVSSLKKDFLKRGTLLYPDPKTGEIYPSLRLEAFRDGIEDMLLLRELEHNATGNSPVAKEAKALVIKLKEVYGISERYDNAPDPAKFRNEILDVLMKTYMEQKTPLQHRII